MRLPASRPTALDHIADASIDAVVIDPPYYANVMYAELSDFFYVWLKRTAGYVYPEWFRRPLTDKENEAVANVAKFKGHKGAVRLAGKEYQQRMAAIFAECRRVLKPEGTMTVMFTHKDNAAWDALTKGMMEAGFVITASWPINTEAEGSLHIKDKAAANSTIFLVCRPRELAGTNGDGVFWEDIEPLVAKAVRERSRHSRKPGSRASTSTWPASVRRWRNSLAIDHCGAASPGRCRSSVVRGLSTSCSRRSSIPTQQRRRTRLRPPVGR